MDLLDVMDFDVRYPRQHQSQLLNKILQSPANETSNHNRRPSRNKVEPSRKPTLRLKPQPAQTTPPLSSKKSIRKQGSAMTPNSLPSQLTKNPILQSPPPQASITTSPSSSSISNEPSLGTPLMESTEERFLTINGEDKENEPFIMSPLPLKPLTEVGDYLVKREIGHGTYGVVKLGEHKVTKQQVAIKVISKSSIKDSKAKARVEQELRLLPLLDHPHIVKVYQVVEDEDHYMIIMEHLTGGELFQYIVKKRRVNERESRYFFRQIVSALDYCHQNAIIHRDMKPENVLLDSNMQIRIIDFGFANFFHPQSTLSTFCGSPYYASPEMVRGMEYIGPEVDIWSLGVTLFTMLSGKLPFNSYNLRTFHRKVIKGEYEMPVYFSQAVGSLISGILVCDKRKRMTMEQIKLHTWTNTGYSDLPNSYLLIRPTAIRNPDPEILLQLTQYGFEKEYAKTALLTHGQNLDPIFCLYVLLDKARQRKKRENSQALLPPSEVKSTPSPCSSSQPNLEISRRFSSENLRDELPEDEDEDILPLTHNYIKAAGRSFDSVSRRCSVQVKHPLAPLSKPAVSPLGRVTHLPNLLEKPPKDGWFTGLFNVTATSTKPRLQIEQELQRVLVNLNINFQVTESRLVGQISHPKLAFEVTITEKDQKLSLHFKNLKGSSWVHKKYCDRIISRMII